MNNNQLLQQLLNLTVWLPIKNYPNYEVSICGMVRNVITKLILKPSISSNGYYNIVLYKNNKSKKLSNSQTSCDPFHTKYKK